jgi:hypothetical protein
MAITCQRAFRAVRSVCLPISTVIGFSFLLTWIFILYQPSIGPGSIQKLGWQSWEIVTLPDLSQVPTPNNQSSTTPTSDAEIEGPEKDWWNSTHLDDKIDFLSFPLDVWAPLLPHNTGCVFCS